jgi:hypothetical protein
MNNRSARVSINWIKRVPLHFFLIAIFPVISLYSRNIHEVPNTVLWRPLILCAILSFITFLLLKLLLKNWLKAALLTTVALILFFIYGHAYDLLKATALADLGIIRHRYLLIIWLVVFITSAWIVISKVHDTDTPTFLMNLIALILIVFPVFQMIQFSANKTTRQKFTEEWLPTTSLLTPTLADTPDVYYIILDTYPRSDKLMAELGYDNSAFIGQLRQLGFYVADCSRANYSNTYNSILSSLNMMHLQDLYMEAATKGWGNDDILIMIADNAVRRNFEAMGYKSVAFDTRYDWLDVQDADLYLERGKGTYGVQLMTPFENMLLDGTPVSIYFDYQSKWDFEKYVGINHPQAYHIGQQEFMLDQLPLIPYISEPTFTYAHVDIPHPPYVFSPDGYLTDPGYFSAPVKGSINEDYFRKGFVYQVQYIDERILEISRLIIERSSSPPIIIVQADHGTGDVNKHPILNAYFVPDAMRAALYPTISPVNTFRLLFNTSYGGEFELLPDDSYYIHDILTPVPELMPGCMPPPAP